MKRSQLKNKVFKLGTLLRYLKILTLRNFIIGMNGKVKLNYFIHMKTDFSEAKNVYKGLK